MCPFQLIVDDDTYKPYLKRRENEFERTDEVAVIRDEKRQIESETSFTNPKQNVEKNEIDIFCTLLDHRNISLDFYFVGPLQ